MKKVIILRGLPGSGKTTWAKNQLKKYPGVYKRINKDDLRNMLDSGSWSRDNEKMVLAVRDILILESLERGKHVIVDDTNINQKHEVRIRQLVKRKAEVEIKEFDTPVEECIQNDLKRMNSVGKDVIMQMYYEQKKRDKITEPPITFGKKDAYIFDIDGTLAKSINRGPFDWEKVGQDEVVFQTAEILHSLKKDHKIIIFSGRDSCCRSETEKWLKSHQIYYDELFMRSEGDTRKDSIVKKEFYDAIKGTYNILGIFDDRKQVKRMWVKNGLFVFDVNQFDLEF